MRGWNFEGSTLSGMGRGFGLFCAGGCEGGQLTFCFAEGFELCLILCSLSFLRSVIAGVCVQTVILVQEDVKDEAWGAEFGPGEFEDLGCDQEALQVRP